MAIKVFIFEDHWMCREALVGVLGREPGIVISGSSGSVAEGMEKVMKSPPDVVLMDIRFNKENLGIEATAKLKKALPETRVIIFTECNDEENLRGAINAGASGFLQKSELQDPDTLAKAIRAVNNGDAFMTPSITAKVLKVMRGQTEKCGFELTPRELQILNLISDGKDNKGIAVGLGIEIRTVANHISNILFKMAAKNRTEAAAIARREGIIE